MGEEKNEKNSSLYAFIRHYNGSCPNRDSQ